MSAFNEAFWTASSAVAPVVALAAIVSLPDQALIGRATELLRVIQNRKASASASDPRMDADLERDARQVRTWTEFALLTATVNLLLQASLLAVSLSSLASKRTLLPLWLAICVGTGGIVLLAVCNSVLIEQHWVLDRGVFREGGEVDIYLTADDSPPYRYLELAIELNDRGFVAHRSTVPDDWQTLLLPELSLSVGRDLSVVDVLNAFGTVGWQVIDITVLNEAAPVRTKYLLMQAKS